MFDIIDDNLYMKSFQRNVLGQTVASGCEGFPTFRELTLYPSSGCDSGLVAPKLVTRCPTLRGVRV
jgi:hypothetical protein